MKVAEPVGMTIPFSTMESSMPGAVLHVNGKEFDPNSVLPTSSFRPYRVYRKGERVSPIGRRGEQLHLSGGFSCDVSSADGLLAVAADDAIVFLTAHYADLALLRDQPAVEDVRIDFGYYSRLDGEHVMVQCDFLPCELLRLAGELRIGFELSLYPTPDTGD